MANKIGLFALKPRTRPTEDGDREGGRQGELNGPKAGRRDYGDWSCFVIEDADFGFAPALCRVATQATGGLGVAVVVFEGAWEFDVFQAGTHVAGRIHHGVAEPALVGDLEAAATALSVSRDVFTRYCVSPTAGLTDDEADDEELLEELQEKYDGYRAFDGDAREPWDEWGFCDFVARLGFGYPNPEDRTTAELPWAIPKDPGGPPVTARPPDPRVVWSATRPNGGAGKKPWWKLW